VGKNVRFARPRPEVGAAARAASPSRRNTVRVRPRPQALLALALSPALALTACAGALQPAAAGPSPPRSPAARAPAHVVLLVGDGMSRAAEVAASRFLTGEDDGLSWHGPEFEYQGFASTWDVTTYDRHAEALGLPPFAPDAFLPNVGYDVLRGGVAPWPVSPHGQDRYLLSRLPLRGGGAQIPATDSASAATALATGTKTDVGNISWAAGDRVDGALCPIALRARELGAAIGIVTTVPFAHATTAAFVARSTTRDATEDLSRQILSLRPEVVIGGGHPHRYRRQHPHAPERWMSPDAHAAARQPGSGWVVVERTADDGGRALLRSAEQVRPDQALLGLFGGTSGAFEPAVPASDGSATVRRGSPENPSLADAALAALAVLARDPDGFFLVVEQGDIDWASHAGDYRWLVGAVWDLDEAVRAVAEFVDRPGDGVTWENTLLVVTADHANGHLRLGAPRGRGVLPSRGEGAFTWGDPGSDAPPGHTNELVTLAARGARARALFGEVEGRWYPGTRIVDNTQIHEVLERALGLASGPPACAPVSPARR
jgi:alkaline phosphatase